MKVGKYLTKITDINKLYLEKVINNEEVNRIYKMSKVEEIKFLKEILQEIDEMMQEEVRDLEKADEDERENRADAYMGI